VDHDHLTLEKEKNRTLVGRPVFKTGEGRQTSLVGSTPTLFRHYLSLISVECGPCNLFAAFIVRTSHGIIRFTR
jgi:hypothetical protein